MHARHSSASQQRAPRAAGRSSATAALLLAALLSAGTSLLAPTVAFSKPKPSTTSRPATSRAVSTYAVGYIDAPAIGESSGLIESRKHEGVFWTHNDSGNPPAIYAIDASGALIESFAVEATNRDWEDIADDADGHLYLAETGNNRHVQQELAVYMIDEPDPAVAQAKPIKVAKRWRLSYPEEAFDCESLFIWDGKGYVISKEADGSQATLYRFELSPKDMEAVQKLTVVGRLPIRAAVTAADISRDGKRLAVQTVLGPCLFEINGDPAAACKATPVSVFWFDPNMEAICFSEKGLMATNERRDVLLFPYAAFAAPK